MDRQHSPCPVCRAHEESSVISLRDRRGNPLTTRLCDGCGHVFNDPIPSAEALAAFYARDYRVSYKGAARPRGRQIVRNFGRVERFWSRWGGLIHRGSKVLDIGAGSGEFLYVAQALGHRTEGVEPNLAYAAYCRDALGLAVRTASIEDLEKNDETYDFIRMNHVLEHLRDPVEALERAARHLTPEGIIYVEVPDIIAYAATKSAGRIFHYGHISNFSAWTLRAAAGRAGLTEARETASAMQGGAAAFFRKGEIWSAEAARNPDNADRVRAALGDHGARPSARAFPKAMRTATKLARSLSDWSVALIEREPRAIGRRFVKRIESVGGADVRPGTLVAHPTPWRT